MAVGIGGSLRVSIDIAAPPSRVWQDLSDIASHVEWMDDARSIQFIGKKQSGAGTRFRCLTQIGRFKVDDPITITHWIDERRMSVEHDGLVSGQGSFFLTPTTTGTDTGTHFVWDETLLFPLYLGGPFADYFARPFLRRVWNNNLLSLKDRCEGPTDINPVRHFAERGITLTTHDRFKVDLTSPAFNEKNYASGNSGYAARAAAMFRWKAEEEPPD